MRWEQLKGSSEASEETRENHRAVDALINKVSWADPDGGASGMGALGESGRTCPPQRNAVWQGFKRGDDQLWHLT